MLSKSSNLIIRTGGAQSRAFTETSIKKLVDMVDDESKTEF
jgi:hypothetical protein